MVDTRANSADFDIPDEIRDIHVKLDANGALDLDDSSVGTGVRTQSSGSEFAALFAALVPRLASIPTQSSFRLQLNVGLHFRAERYACRGGTMIALRRLPKAVPDLSELRLPHLWADLFLSEELCQGGLILVVAPTGAGKSVTLASIGASRLKRFGGYMTTIEDPIEMPLHGWFGRGKSVQTEIDSQDEPALAYVRALRAALRAYPTAPEGGTLLLFGEVRDQASAAEVLRAANQGHLVMTTLHGSGIESALRRLVAMATRDLGETQARDLVAAALRIAITQTLHIDPSRSGWDAGVIGGTMLYSSGEKSPVAGNLREDDPGGLTEQIDQQRSFLSRLEPPSLADFHRRFRR